MPIVLSEYNFPSFLDYSGYFLGNIGVYENMMQRLKSNYVIKKIIAVL